MKRIDYDMYIQLFVLLMYGNGFTKDDNMF